MTDREGKEHPPPRRGWRRVWRSLLLLAMTLALLGLIHGYLAHKAVVGLGLSGTGARVARGVMVWLFLSIPLVPILGSRLPRRLQSSLWPLAYLWPAALGPLLTFLLGGELVRAAAAPWLGPRWPQDWPQLHLRTALLLTAASLLVGYWRAKRPLLREVEIPLPGLARELDGLRIVQLSDLHIGETLGEAFLAGVVERVNALSADLVVVTGDLVEGEVAEVLPELAPLSRLSAPHGVYFVTGNHEYYHGGLAWTEALGQLGMEVLHNRHVVLERGRGRLVLAGVPDLAGAGVHPDHLCRPRAALEGAPEGVTRVLLAHQPRVAYQAEPAGYDLQLSGHTHGGQIFPFTLFVRLQQPAVAGLRRRGRMWLYTSRGTGYWGPPFRVGAPGEITVLTLRRAPG